MALIDKREITKGCILGTWEITEDYDRMMEMIKLDSEELDLLHSFGNHNRKLEYLSVRLLLRELTGKRERILYTASKKPYLRSNNRQISISHSYKLTSILTSTTKKVGIDIEYMSHRIEKIRDRFIHPDEFIADDPELTRYHLYVHWCAKEALYKICDKNLSNFRDDLFIHPFKIGDNGILKANVNTETIKEEFELQYFRWDNYVLVMCCK